MFRIVWNYYYYNWFNVIMYWLLKIDNPIFVKGFTPKKTCQNARKYANIPLGLPIEIIPINKFNLHGIPYATSQQFVHNFYYFNLNFKFFFSVCVVCVWSIGCRRSQRCDMQAMSICKPRVDRNDKQKKWNEKSGCKTCK